MNTKMLNKIFLFLFIASILHAGNDLLKIVKNAAVQVRYYSSSSNEEFIDQKISGTEENENAVFKNYSDGTLKTALVTNNYGGYLEISGEVENLTSSDKCFTARVILPFVTDEKLTWNKDIHTNIAAEKEEIYGNLMPLETRVPPDGAFNIGDESNGGYGDKVGAGKISLYPVMSVSAGNEAIAIGVDMGIPLVYRLLFEKGKGFIAEFDLAVSKETVKFPGRAFFKLLLFKCDAQWGLRSALEKYYSIMGSHFKKNVEREGIWLPFTPLMTIENFEDFGIVFHETQWRGRDNGNGGKSTFETAIQNKVYGFQYTEPWDIQIPINSDKLSYDDATGEKTIPKDHSTYLQGSAALDYNGRYYSRKLETPWFDSGWAVSITTNVDPELKGYNRYLYVRDDEINDALKLNSDGIYFDSIEWNWPNDLNYNKAHFATTDFPLTFSSGYTDPRPAIWNYVSEYEMMKQIADEMHSQNKLTMGNGFHYTPFAAGVLDLFGAEFDWYNPDDYSPEKFGFLRAISYQKPIVFLLNQGFEDQDFTTAPYDGYRKYFERLLAYGFFPSFFSADASNNPYWANPEKYNQGRPYFKKYIPLIKKISAAGWQPVTYAASSNSEITIERFGEDVDSGIYFTLYNKDSEMNKTNVTFPDGFIDSDKTEFEELITGEKIVPADNSLSIELPPLSARLIKVINK